MNPITKSLILGAALLTSAGVYAQSPIHVTPAPGVVPELSEFIITFDGDWGLADRTAKFSVTGPEGVEIPKLMSYSLGKDGGYCVYFEDDAVLTTPGDYTFTIPAHRFEIDGVDCEETTFDYTISNGSDDPDAYTGPIVITPAPGSYETIGEWTLAFDGTPEIALVDGISLTSDQGIVLLSMGITEDNLVQIMVFNEDQALTEAGHYTLTIEQGAITIDGKKIPAQSYSYIITGEQPTFGLPKYEMVPEPGSYVSITDGFALYFETAEPITLTKGSVFINGPQAYLALTAEVCNATSDAERSYIKITPVDDNGQPVQITEKGLYTLFITMGAVKIGDARNDEPYVFDYNITGSSSIATIAADAADVDIYDLNGRRIPTSTPGHIYIINGQKHITH